MRESQGNICGERCGGAGGFRAEYGWHVGGVGVYATIACTIKTAL
jgi:hypothetical protein